MSTIAITSVAFPHVTGSGSAGSTPVRTRLHLTRRGRVFLSLIVTVPLIATLGFLILLRGVGVAAATDAPPPTVSHITVMPGQSLWQIAESVAPHSDPRTVVSELISFNGLSGSVVMPGQSLAIPAGL